MMSKMRCFVVDAEDFVRRIPGVQMYVARGKTAIRWYIRMRSENRLLTRAQACKPRTFVKRTFASMCGACFTSGKELRVDWHISLRISSRPGSFNEHQAPSHAPPQTLPERQSQRMYQRYSSLSHHFLNIHFQRWLVPQRHDVAPLHPVSTARIELHIECPDDLGEDKAHLSVSETLAETVSTKTSQQAVQRAEAVGRWIHTWGQRRRVAEWSSCRWRTLLYPSSVRGRRTQRP